MVHLSKRKLEGASDPPPPLTCRGQHGAGEEQGGHEVPVPLAAVAQHAHPVVAGLERAGQKLLQARVGHAGVVAQEVPPGRHQLVPEILLVGPLDGGEDAGAGQQVEDVTGDQQREIQRGPVPLHRQGAPAVAADADHHSTSALPTHLLPPRNDTGSIDQEQPQ